MLIICKSIHDIPFEQLAEVYKESLKAAAEENHCLLSDYERNAFAYQQFLEDIRDFFLTPGAVYALWEPEGRCMSALRLEPYCDGWLIAGLETMPQARRKGCAKKLLTGVMRYLSDMGPVKLYSHIHKKNIASVNLHVTCGFNKLKSCAVFLDSSVSQQYDTYIFQE